MWLVRMHCHKSYWPNVDNATPETIARAAKDCPLVDEGEGGLSVFELANDEEATKAAVLYEIAHDWRPETWFYLMFAPDLVGQASMQYGSQAVPQFPLFLSERHCEIHPFVGGDARKRLVQIILESRARRLQRIRKRDYVDLARQFLDEDPNLSQFVGPRWKELLRQEPTDATGISERTASSNAGSVDA